MATRTATGVRVLRYRRLDRTVETRSDGRSGNVIVPGEGTPTGPWVDR